VDRCGGPGPSVHRGPIKGVRALFKLGRPRRSDGPGRVWARSAGNGRCVAAPADGAAAARRRRAKDGLPTTKLDGEGTKTKRSTREIHRATCTGGLDGGEGTAAATANGAWPASARGMKRHRAHGLKRGWPSSPCYEPPGGLFGDGEVMKREIEAAAAGSGIGRSSTLCPGERRRLRSAGSPWVVRTTGEDEESPGKVSIGVEGAPSTCDGAAAESSTRRRAHGRERERCRA
jgi:hypothetical protein